MKKLNINELDKQLKQLSNWSLVNGKLYKEFIFTDFKNAFSFMTEVAKKADTMDHHPDWSNSYNKVGINLSTHSAGGITEIDIKFAKAIEKSASKYH